jgi:hypothetical protein
VFTPHIPRAGKSDANNSAPLNNGARLKKVGGFVTAIALGTSFMALVPLSAQADTTTTTTGSYAEGQFLSGTIAGTNLDNVVALKAAEARNSGEGTTTETKDPLSAAVLKAINLNVPGGIQLNLGSIIDAGALSQYAKAAPGGTSLGASGAVSNDGAIGVGGTGDGTGGNLSVDLDSLLNARFASVISDLRLQVQAVAAQAQGSTDAVSGTYNLAGLKLNFTSPALADFTAKTASSLDGVTSQLDSLGGANGDLTKAVNGVLVNLNPVLNALGSSATVDASVTTDLTDSVQPLLTGTYTTPGITLDLATGSVSVDLDKLAGGLNNKPAGYEVLTDAMVNQIVNSITKQLASLVDQIKDKVNVALHSATVKLDVDVKALSSTPGTAATPGTPGITTTVCSLLGVLKLPVCQPVTTGGTAGTPAIPGVSLESDADVHVNGTVDQILNGGTGATATATASLLGGTIPVNLDVKAVLGSLGSTLTDKLFDSNGAVSTLVNSLDTNLLNPAVTALVGPSGSSVNDALTGLLSIKLNNKETTVAGSQGMAVASGTLFTETAVRVTVLKDLGSSSLATLNLAQATVGPQVAVVVTPGGPTGDPTCTVNCSTSGNPSTPSTPTASTSSSLAFTGVGIATIIAVILALLAAGAYLAREGYRRKHLSQL